MIAKSEPLSRQEAQNLENQIIKGIEALEQNLLRFVEGRGWEPLGFKSFLAWWDDRVVSVRVGPAIRAVVVRELQAPDPETQRKLTDRETAERLGVTPATVQRDTGRKKERKINSGANAPKMIKGSTAPPKPVEVIPQPEPQSVPAVVDAEVVYDSADGTESDESDIAYDDSETLAEITGRLTRKVRKAREILLDVLTDPDITPDIPKLILDELIPELEKEAADVERRMQW